MSIRRLLASLLLIVSAVVGSAMAAEPETPQRSMTAAARAWALTFTEAETYIRSAEKTAARQQAIGNALNAAISEAMLLRESAQRELASQQRLLEALGPPPAEGQPPETAEITNQRKALNAAIGVERAHIAQADLAVARAKALQDELSKVYRADFRSRILEHSVSPLSPSVMAKGIDDIRTTLGAMGRAPVAWFRGLSDEQEQRFWFQWQTIAVVAAALAAWPLRYWLLRRLGPNPVVTQPSYARRLVAAIAVAVANGMMPSVLLAAFYLRIKTDLNLNAGLAAAVVTQASIALIFLINTMALSRAALAPGLPAWRITRLTPQSARRLDRTIIFLAAVFAVDWAVGKVSAPLTLSLEAKVVWAFFAGAIEALGLLLLTRSSLWRSEPESRPVDDAAAVPAVSDAPDDAAKTDQATPVADSRFGKAFRAVVAAAAVLSVLAVALGYVGLGHFVMRGLLNSTVVLAALYVLKRLAEESIAVLSSVRVHDGRIRFDGKERGNLRFWLDGAVTILIFGLGLYALLAVWGVPRVDLDRWLLSAASGFAVGGVTISFIDIGAAIAVFAIGVFIAGRLRAVLDHRVLPRTALDAGVRNSLATAAGYAGVVLAAIIAIAVAGIDLSNIAIVAGALSVGIGFGLQNIVNNFVSGLILLAERPIKVGDWVVVGAHQGYVRNISVRATEIQTFDRSSVILPNSELLSQSVVNLTHKDKTGRVEIRVGVSYGADVDLVRKLLLECANAHPEIVSWPKASVYFVEFGASSLDFVLYAYLVDVEKRLGVSSELRFAIHKAFRENGIEIPYAQSDVHIRDMDRLVAALLTSASAAGVPPAPPVAAPPPPVAAPPPAAPPPATPPPAAPSPEPPPVSPPVSPPAQPPLQPPIQPPVPAAGEAPAPAAAAALDRLLRQVPKRSLDGI